MRPSRPVWHGQRPCCQVLSSPQRRRVSGQQLHPLVIPLSPPISHVWQLPPWQSPCMHPHQVPVSGLRPSAANTLSHSRANEPAVQSPKAPIVVIEDSEDEWEIDLE